MEDNQLQISTLVASDLGKYGISMSLSQSGSCLALSKELSIHLPGEELTQQPTFQVFLNLMMEHDAVRQAGTGWGSSTTRGPLGRLGSLFHFLPVRMYPSFLLHLCNPQDSSLLISPAVHTSTHICMNPPNEVLWANKLWLSKTYSFQSNHQVTFL